MRITAILVILSASISVVHGQERSNVDRKREGQRSGSQQEKSGASMSLFDAAGKAHRIYQDWNATPRTTDFLLQNATGSEESVSAASSVVFLPQLTGTVWNGAATGNGCGIVLSKNYSAVEGHAGANHQRRSDRGAN